MKAFSTLSVLVGIAGLLLLGVPAGEVWADGTETLGPPSIAIASGTGIVAAGTGLSTQPGTINVSIPAGATVQQVLLYWEGQDLDSFTGDDTITVNGIAVTGTQIGGPVFWRDRGVSTTYRAVITGLGLVGPGANTLTVGGLTFTKFANGAGVLVVIDDGSSSPSNIDIRDGNDLAFINWTDPPPAGALPGQDTTVAQTFTFPASNEQRTATLTLFFSAVSGTNSSTGGTLRPTAIDITVGGVTDTINNLLDSVDGQEWDTVVLPVTIPAGETEVTVQAFSVDNLGIGGLPASLTWNAAGLSVPPPPGCSIGDYVWEDANRNGCQDGDERPIEGVEVTLRVFDKCGEPLLETKKTETDMDGFYEFTGLDCGKEYRVKFGDAGDIYAYTEKDSCTVGDPPEPSDTKDSDCNTNGLSGCVTFPDPENEPDNPTIDCGYVCEGKIGDYVWFDDPEDGCQEPNAGIGGVYVTLSEDCVDRGNPKTVPTNADGSYEFTGLCPGEYFVEFDDGIPNTAPGQDCSSTDPPGPSDTKDSNCGDEDLQCVTLTRDNPEDPTIDCGKIPECGLSVTKGCEIPVPGPPSVGKCEGKLQQFTVVWNGSGPIDISVGDGLTGSSQTSAMPGDEVTFFTDGSTNDTIVNLSGSVFGQSTFHVSCSDKDMDGDTATNEDQQQVSPIGRDCGKDQGDGKGDSGFINQWLLEGFVDNANAVLDCTVDAGVGDPSCTFQSVAADCDFPVKDPDILTFRVTGGDCSASDNAQEPGKTECTGGFINPNQAVQVSVNGDPRFTLQPGETFDVERGGDPEIELFQGNVTQFNKFHASCSQPLQAGDRYGANELVALDGNGLGTTVVYSYQVSNAGPGDLTGITVTDDKLGTVPGSPIDLAEGASETLTATAFITQDTINIATAIASPTCAADSNQVTVTVLPPPECDVSIAFKELKDDAILWTLTNGDQSKATLNTLKLDFLGTTFGAIKEVKLDGAIFKSGDSNTYPDGVPSGATIGPGDWTEDDVAKRQLERGEERTLEVKFTQQDKNASQGDFDLFVTFEEGCEVTF